MSHEHPLETMFEAHLDKLRRIEAENQLRQNAEEDGQQLVAMTEYHERLVKAFGKDFFGLVGSYVTYEEFPSSSEEEMGLPDVMLRFNLSDQEFFLIPGNVERDELLLYYFPYAYVNSYETVQYQRFYTAVTPETSLSNLFDAVALALQDVQRRRERTASSKLDKSKEEPTGPFLCSIVSAHDTAAQLNSLHKSGQKIVKVMYGDNSEVIIISRKRILGLF